MTTTKLFLIISLFALTNFVSAQKMSLEQYQLVQDFKIDDLDNDTYIKINQEYVLDRYKMKPPYFIAGADGTKNRVDLYKLIKRENLAELGLLMVYTNTGTGKVTNICMPFLADQEVWIKYYDALKYGGQNDPAMIFAISSVLSRELSNVFIQGEVGEDYEVESSDYDICFPAGSQVLMASQVTRNIERIKAGDEIMAVNENKLAVTATVVDVQVHEKKSPLVKVISRPSGVLTASIGHELAPYYELSATANHPVLTKNGYVKISELVPGDEVLGLFNGKHAAFRVRYVATSGKAHKVYNLVTDRGNYVINSIVVSDK